ncbi:hypothetical protein SATMO3_20890 [Sporomusa aerivorans]
MSALSPSCTDSFPQREVVRFPGKPIDLMVIVSIRPSDLELLNILFIVLYIFVT